MRAFTPVQVPCMATCGAMAMDFGEALEALAAAVRIAERRYAHHASGLLRIEVPLPRGASALQWLQGQPLAEALLPRVYFSPRRSSAPATAGGAAAAAGAEGAGAVAGAGAAWLWQGAPGAALDEGVVGGIQAFLSEGAPRVRALGGSRFDPAAAPAREWAPFGAFCMLLPRLELLEAATCSLLACTLAWRPRTPDPDTNPTKSFHAGGGGGGEGRGPDTLAAACAAALVALAAARGPAPASAPSLQVVRHSLAHLPDEAGWRKAMQPLHDALAPVAENPAEEPYDRTGGGDVDPAMAREEYELGGQQGLDELLAALGAGGEAVVARAGGEAGSDRLTKVVLARRTDVRFTGQLDALSLLATLQERDPRSYQAFLQVPGGAAFLACTPEQLYARTGRAVASEAVAATRARGPPGDVETDFWLAFDLLRSGKDHAEFSVVREWVRAALVGLCEGGSVRLEREKSVLKQGAVQHLYARLAGTLARDASDAALLAALHPTPAVCGRPRDAARAELAAREPFDRGFYAGPFGWVTGAAAEFVVAIRSALVEGEWAELELKVAQFEALLRAPPALAAAPNLNALWARLLVEEFCRAGCSTFCVAPGSRSSPLAAAAAAQPRARLVPCIDERSLAFWALGHGRACGRPAVVITSSGTAVANLLPAVVEASAAGVPLVLLTADRPAELRGTGANQTIDQVKIFGGYVRWAADLGPPDAAVPARAVLAAADEAVRRASGPAAGPVHLNLQFREPLAPVLAPWPAGALVGTERWEASRRPFTAHAALPAAAWGSMGNGATFGGELGEALACLASARRGLLVLGELPSAADAAAALRVARALGWPVAADVLSGVRVGAVAAPGCPPVLHHFDHLLLDAPGAAQSHASSAADPEPAPDPDTAALRAALRPDAVLQLGGRLTSKRTQGFLEWAALPDACSGRPAAAWLFAGAGAQRHDQAHLLSHAVELPLPALAHVLEQDLPAARETLGPSASRAAADDRTAYAALLQLLDGVAGREIDAALAEIPGVAEPFVARELSRVLPLGDALFLGNSMPIRDMDMYATAPLHSPASPGGGAVASGLGAPVAANRGASGIDGVLSTAAGWAAGLGRAATLLLGDISFLHDINGLNLLRTGELQAPLTIVLVNNGGGGIFSFLPVADAVPEDAFTPLWATPQNVDLAGMCRAHGIAYQRVAEPEGLCGALAAAWGLNRHSVVEVATARRANVAHHRQVQAAVGAAVARALRLATRPGAEGLCALPLLQPPLRVKLASLQRYALPLAAPMTMCPNPTSDPAEAPLTTWRAGLLLRVYVAEPGGREACGIGEIAPLPGLHAESLAEAEAAAAVAVNGLVACEGASACAAEAARLVSAGFMTLKIKVARLSDPLEDAAAVAAVRAAVGPSIRLRADANRRWSLQEAIAFGRAAAASDLEYVEEPVRDPTDLPAFYAATGVATALDETLDALLAGAASGPAQGAGLAAVVVKPAVVGGFEVAAAVARWAARAGVRVVVSSAFESSVALAQYAHLAAALEGVAWVDPHGGDPRMGGENAVSAWVDREGGGWRCLALDLPGHGDSAVDPARGGEESAHSLEASADAVAACLAAEGLTRRAGSAGPSCLALVGYSLGARLALVLVVAMVSGLAGLRGAVERAERRARDDAAAAALRSGGVEDFVHAWYRAPLWASLRAHPRFPELLARRACGGDAAALAAALVGASPGRAPDLWAALPALWPQLLFVAGALDAKFSHDVPPTTA
ncbi:hypothetical protein WJX81_002656 [Elliptochloris bilobata]|uniref:Mandelate racemase/muconate lactonizing enzyme C-terminal domain-containing protein n=1 Tax=Elliptochloris bilobata TaxID=381761 RepID=A0AAW1RUX6_9CHLO